LLARMAWMLAAWLALVPVAFAQAELLQTDPARVAPKVIELPDIVLPAGSPPIEAVEATIVVSADGVATLESSDAPPEIAAVIAEVLSRARFAPATADGVAVPARVRVRLVVAAAPPEPIRDVTTEVDDTDVDAGVVDDEEIASPVSAYEAVAITQPIPPTARRLEIEEMRDVPGAFGDPFRVLDTLPGVVPIFGGLPYVYVRGAPPAATVYFYDDIAVPQLFHFGLLAAVVHPAMLGDLLFYPSVAPARFGRKSGGVFGAEGPESANDRLSGEVELRLLDVSGMLNIPLSGGGRVLAAARYGYPGLAASIFVDNFTLAYWDYQLRVDLPVGAHDRFQFAWFGSYDNAGERGKEITITFHRAEVRLMRELRTLQVGAAMQLGFDQTAASDDGFSVGGVRFGPRFWLTYKPSNAVRLRVGGDMLATAGEVKTGNGTDGEQPSVDPPPIDPNAPPVDPQPDGGGGRDGDPIERADPLAQQVKGRNMIGVYAELNLHPTPPWEFGLGVRGDLWTTGSTEEHAVEPRATLTFHPDDVSDVYVATGLAYQPAVFPIPIPGLADIVLDNGLQRAAQLEGGYRTDFGDELRLETSVFFNHYTGLLFLNVAFDCDGDSTDADCDKDGFPRSTSNAYGLEVFLKRGSHHRVSGWLSYTFGGATATGPTGRDFVPETDVRHFGNAVVQFDLGRNWKFGLRAFFRTGRVSFDSSSFDPDRRLPGYARLDAMISNRWPTRWGHMRLSLEWFNTTFSREPIGFRCGEINEVPAGTCSVDYAPAIVIPNIGLRGEF